MAPRKPKAAFASHALTWVARLPRTAPRATVTAVAFGMAAWFWGPAFFDPFATGFGDWQLVHHNWEAAFVALSRYGEWPLWDPFHCGGVPLHGHPEAQHFSPFFFLSFLVGTTLAIKLMIVAHAWAGIGGMYLLARKEHDLSPPASWLAAVGWGCSGFFAWQIGAGHGTFISFYLAPVLLFVWRRAARDLRWVAAVVAIMALTIFEGGTYPAPYFVLLLGFDALVRFVRGERRGGILRAGLLAVPLTALVAAVRLWPIYETLQRIPRAVSSQDHMAFAEIAPMLLRHHFPWMHPEHPYVWNEYANFMGWGLVLFAVVGLVRAARNHRFELLAGLGLFGALMLGYRGPYWPWALLHQLPVYDALRVPSRFSVLFGLYLVLLAGLTVDRIPDWLERLRQRRSGAWLARAERRPRIGAALRHARWVLVVLVLIEPFWTNVRTVNRWHRDPIDTSSTKDIYRQIPGGNYRDVYASLPRMNQGTPRCYRGNMKWNISDALWTNEKAQVRLHDIQGVVHDWGWTSSRAWADVTLHEAGTVLFNQNYAPGWQSSVGRVVAHKGLLAVEAPEGRHRIEVRYRPDALPTQVAMSLLGLVATLGIAWARPIRRHRASSKAGDRT